MKQLTTTLLLLCGLLQMAQAQNVGIGTTSPNAALHVRYATANTFTDTPALIIDNLSGGTQTTLQLKIDGSEKGRIRADGGGNMYYAAAGTGNHYFKGNTDLSDLMLIDASGNVGIGTFSPSARLHVYGTLNDMLKLESASTTGTWLKLQNTSGGGNTFSLISTGAANGEGTGKLMFNGPSGLSMLMDGTGKIGMGTASPAAKLHLKYTSANSSNDFPVLILDNPTGGTQTSLQFQLNGAEKARIRVDNNGDMNYSLTGSGNYNFRINTDSYNLLQLAGNSGNVGIGMENPNARLYVNGVSTLGTAAFAGTDAVSHFNLGNGTEDTYIRGGKNSSRVVINDISTGYTLLATGTSLVGIGTSSPTEKLEVNGKTKTTNLQITNGATNGYLLRSDASGNASWVSATASVVAGTGLSYSGNTLNSVWTVSGNNIYKNNTGNVGIGLSTPLAQLHLSGNLAIDNDNSNNGDLSAGALTFGFNISGEGIASKRTAGGNQFGLDFYTDNTNRVAITLDGNVGIGTTSPNSMLHIYKNNGTATIVVQSTSASAGLNLNNAGSGFESAIATFSNSVQRWSFGKNNTAESGSNTGSDFFINRYNDAGTFQSQPLVIKRNTGFVGINQGSPTQQLDVNGSINVNPGNGYYIGGAKVLAINGTDNLFAGASAGAANTGSANTFIGKTAGQSNTGGNDNTALGFAALLNNTTGNFNTALGSGAGVFATGSNNVLLGYGAGVLAGSGNIMIGFSSGGSESGNNKLYIDNSNTAAPLVYGDFSKDSLSVNGSLNIAGAMGLKVKTGQVAGTNNPNATGGIWFYASGTGTIDLNGAAYTDRLVIILNNTGATRTISSYRDLANTAQTTIANNVSLWLVYDGTNWRQIK